MDRVLVVDDNLSIQKLVSVNLQARGYAVDVAGTGEEALRLFKEGEYDLVILDLILPGMSGIDVCGLMRQLSDIPIVVLSAREDEELKVRALDTGADDYVTKPFSPKELLARVRAVMRRAKADSAAKLPEIHIKDLTIDLAGTARLRWRGGHASHADGIRAAGRVGSKSRGGFDARSIAGQSLGAGVSRFQSLPACIPWPDSQEAGP